VTHVCDRAGVFVNDDETCARLCGRHQNFAPVAHCVERAIAIHASCAQPAHAITARFTTENFGEHAS